MNTKRRLPFFCTAPMCTGKAVARGLCDKHWQRAKFRGDLKDKPRYQRKTCLVKGCELKHYCHGFCSAHFGRMLRNGTIQHTRRLDKSKLIVTRRSNAN